jgi:hypothetical protein
MRAIAMRVKPVKDRGGSVYNSRGRIHGFLSGCLWHFGRQACGLRTLNFDVASSNLLCQLRQQTKRRAEACQAGLGRCLLYMY